MKFIFILVLISLLSACGSTSFFKENTSENEVISNTNSISDDAYLQIAKDLFVAQQYKQAYQIASTLADKNNVEAQYLLGYMVYYGYGVTSDPEQGTKWITISADTGYRPAIEALVLIKHGLTPDNKCSAVNLLPESESNKRIDKTANTTDASMLLKEGEILITPKKKAAKKSLAVEPKLVTKDTNSSTEKQSPKAQQKEPEKNWNKYTIQLIMTNSSTYAKQYVQAFKEQYPDISQHIIVYQSKLKKHDYGVGYSAYETRSDANIVLSNIQERLKDPKLWVRRLDNFTAVELE
ncbi:tetratricopeptide repeat protein [sulfur-oxidizing endosymbiont of Gigantopelta aegis]|uniref:tetratricopeptide repeat protein n=1 Tax=sulfur-oxidizing endosymbiont of Gigantopelta aegis TaxID=2794934 RepID=UPI0018DE9490|nr:sel1 repeat family protein [sulfur-oxidizing endosymbiont of Gigantopelta aegis]